MVRIGEGSFLESLSNKGETEVGGVRRGDFAKQMRKLPMIESNGIKFRQDILKGMRGVLGGRAGRQYGGSTGRF